MSGLTKQGGLFYQPLDVCCNNFSVKSTHSNDKTTPTSLYTIPIPTTSPSPFIILSPPSHTCSSTPSPCSSISIRLRVLHWIHDRMSIMIPCVAIYTFSLPEYPPPPPFCMYTYQIWNPPKSLYSFPYAPDTQQNPL